MFNKARLSDGFKGIINKINSNSSPTKETASVADSEATSSTMFDDQDEQFLLDDDDIDREGFLCPLCLTAFPSGAELQTHYATVHAEEVNSSSSVLCSVCKMRFGSQKGLCDGRVTCGSRKAPYHLISCAMQHVATILAHLF